jgi:hypothetical protein
MLIQTAFDPGERVMTIQKRSAGLLVFSVLILAGCGDQDGASTTTGQQAAYEGSSSDEGPAACREYVVEKAALFCENYLRSNVSAPPAEGHSRGVTGSCDLASYASTIGAKAADYADQDAISVAHNSGQEIDWGSVASRCETGASIETDQVCDSTGASGC